MRYLMERIEAEAMAAMMKPDPARAPGFTLEEWSHLPTAGRCGHLAAPQVRPGISLFVRQDLPRRPMLVMDCIA